MSLLEAFLNENPLSTLTQENIEEKLREFFETADGGKGIPSTIPIFGLQCIECGAAPDFRYLLPKHYRDAHGYNKAQTADAMDISPSAVGIYLRKSEFVRGATDD